MKYLKKHLFAGIIAGAMLFTGTISAYAADVERPPKPPKIDISEVAKNIAKQYDVNEKEVFNALKEERSMDDIHYAAIFAKVSGKSFQQVFAMKSDWFDVMQKLGITHEQYEEAVLDLMATDIAERGNVDKETVKKLLNNHYMPRDIMIASRLAKASKKDIQSILNMKKINQRWGDVANELGVDKNLVRPHTPEEEEDIEN